jgi:chromosome segregation ATPase
VTERPDDKEVELFKQHLTYLRERREDALAQIATSREMIEQSRALIVQIDEQINRIERELNGGIRAPASLIASCDDPQA